MESGDRESLLVDWLNEVLYWFDGKRIAFREFRVTRLERPAPLQAIGMGEPRDPERHRARLIVKAVTYHQLKIEAARRHVDCRSVPGHLICRSNPSTACAIASRATRRAACAPTWWCTPARR